MSEFIHDGYPPLVSGITQPHPCKCECGTMIEDEMRDGKPTKFVNDRHQKNFRNAQGILQADGRQPSPPSSQ